MSRICRCCPGFPKNIKNKLLVVVVLLPGPGKTNTVFASGSPHPQMEPFSGCSPQVDLPGWICLDDFRWCCHFWFRGQQKQMVTSHSFCSFLKHNQEETPPPSEGLIQADFPGRTSLHGLREAENGLREVVVLLTLGNFLSTATLKTEQNALEVSIFLLNQRSHGHNPWSTIPTHYPMVTST